MNGWHGAKRILCVRLDNMGDVLMTTPAMQALKDSDPSRHLTLLTSSGAAALASHLPMIDTLLAWDAPWVKGHGTGNNTGSSVLPWAQRLQAARFDAAVIFTVYSQSPLPAALLCTMAGIPLRLAHCRENPYQLLSDWVPETEPQTQLRHETQRQLDLVATVGAVPADTRLRFRVQPHDRRAIQRQLQRWQGEGAPPACCVVVHPGATAESRRWPAERFAEVARALAEQHDALVLLTGGVSEQPLVDSVRAAAGHPRVIGVAGELTLGQMGALVEHADLLVSNNSGPVHLAAALGTPVVDLYALTNPQHTPWQVPHRTLYADVPCRYCYKSVCPQQHHRCLNDVDAAAVIEAARELLAGVPVAADVMPPLIVPATPVPPLPPACMAQTAGSEGTTGATGTAIGAVGALLAT